MNLAEKSLVCFDLGGVLVKMARSWNECLKWAGLERHCRPDLEIPVHAFEPYNLHELGAMPDGEYLARLAEFLGLPTPEDALRAHLGFLGDPYPGTLELVEDVHRAGLRTACLSNTEEWHWRKMTGPDYPAVQALQIQTASHLLNARKPDPAIFRAVSELAGAPPERVVYFDDVSSNVDGARAAGWEAHHVDRFGDPAAQMRAILGL